MNASDDAEMQAATWDESGRWELILVNSTRRSCHRKAIKAFRPNSVINHEWITAGIGVLVDVN